MVSPRPQCNRPDIISSNRVWYMRYYCVVDPLNLTPKDNHFRLVSYRSISDYYSETIIRAPALNQVQNLHQLTTCTVPNKNSSVDEMVVSLDEHKVQNQVSTEIKMNTGYDLRTLTLIETGQMLLYIAK